MTFWSDLQSTYFQKLDSAKITTLLDGIRGTESNTDDSHPDNNFMGRHLNEFFSFYSFYQDVINDLQDNCNYEGKYIYRVSTTTSIHIPTLF